MQMAKVPNFLRVIPEEYKTDEFRPSSWAIKNSKHKIPINLIRYRRNPETGELESNTNIYRWSDGSLTMQVGEEHYDIQVKEQIPPPNKPYVADRDAHRYFAAAHMFDQQMLTVGHISEEWTIRPDKQRIDEDTEMLREQMSRARPGMKEGEMIITTTQDPELQKKQAEMAEKERVRAQRRRENAQARVDGGGGGGGGGYRRGGLSIDALEGGRRSTAGRKRGPGGGPKRRRRGDSEYDSDDDLPAGAHGQNEYDREDDFIASSDNDDNESGDNNDNEEEDDILDVVDRDQHEKPRAKRQRTEHSDVDEDADGEPEGSAAAHAADHARRHRRRVVDDDDDEE